MPPHPIPPLPAPLVSQILHHLLPPRPPLPYHLLAKPLLDRLTFLPPDPAEVDAWICPLPAEVSNPIASRLGECAGGAGWGGVEYAWDGEGVFARRVLWGIEGSRNIRECADDTVRGDGRDDMVRDEVFGEDGLSNPLGKLSLDNTASLPPPGIDHSSVELHFAYEPKSSAWKFHGALLPPSHLEWVPTVELLAPHLPLDWLGESEHAQGHHGDVDSGLGIGMSGGGGPSYELDGTSGMTYGMDLGQEASAGPQVWEDSGGSGMSHGYGTAPAGYWSGYDDQDKIDLNGDGAGPGAAGDGLGTEDDYWARYSAGVPSGPASAAVTPGPSRRPSGRPDGGSGVNGYGSGDGVGNNYGNGNGNGSGKAGSGRSARSSILGLSPFSPSLPFPKASPTSLAPPRLNVQASGYPSDAATSSAAGPDSGAGGTLLRQRLTMKLASLLRRAWDEHCAGAEEQGEMEERAMGWLAMGRSFRGPDQRRTSSCVAIPALGEDMRLVVARAKLEVLEGIWSVLGENEGEDGFYRLMEGAMKLRDGIGRTYSTEQLSFWE